MIDLFVMGGTLFMSIVTIGLILVLVAIVRGSMVVFGGTGHTADEVNDQLSLIKSAGLFALVCGVLGQMIGLYSAFSAIEQMGTVAPAMLAGGLKVSSITTLYGLAVYAFSLAAWLFLKAMAKNR